MPADGPDPRAGRHALAAGAVWLAVIALVMVIVGLAARIPNLAGTGVLVGFVALALSRVVRHRAVNDDNASLASAGRWSQRVAWVAIGPFIGLILLAVVFVAVLIFLFAH